jgi:hypothetical protein
MRLSMDGEPCPAMLKSGQSIPQGCEGYSKTPEMVANEKKGTSLTTVFGSSLVLMAATFLGYMFLSRRH